METQTNRKSPKSPKFMKPSEVFKMRKKKRLTQSPTKKSPLKIIYSPLKCLENYQNSKEVLTQKSFSPFKQKRTPNKRNKIRNAFPIVKKLSPKGKRQLIFHTITNSNNNNNNNNNNIVNIDENANIESANVSEIREAKQYLIDWSLKTKVRFVANKAFGFRGNFRATEEAVGISGFVRCFQNSCSMDSDQSSQSSQDSMDTSFASLLHKQCLVWSHPSLPWLTLFPRNKSPMPGTPVSSKAPTFSIMPNTPLADALHTDWCASLKSLYQLLKAKHCPYFYVCANGFTALFRASGVAGCDDIHVMITPTTTGFRKLLKDEGIAYSLPFYDNNKTLSGDDMTASFVSNNSCSVVSDVNNYNNNENCDNAEDEEPTVWLESLGLSQQDFPSLQPKRKNRSLENAVSKMKSLAIVKGMSSSQLFLNFLINTRICVANSGPLSGVPPTLLSPVAFHGSTLESLKVKQTIAENETTHDSYHCLEICGPILPNAVNGLIRLLKESRGCFKGYFNTYEPTTSLTACNVSIGNNLSSKAFAIENLKDCGIDKEFLRLICCDEYRTKDPVSQLLANNLGIIYNERLNY